MEGLNSKNKNIKDSGSLYRVIPLWRTEKWVQK